MLKSKAEIKRTIIAAIAKVKLSTFFLLFMIFFSRVFFVQDRLLASSIVSPKHVSVK